MESESFSPPSTPHPGGEQGIEDGAQRKPARETLARAQYYVWWANIGMGERRDRQCVPGDGTCTC